MNSDEYANEIAMRERRANEYLIDKQVDRMLSNNPMNLVYMGLFVAFAMGIVVGMLINGGA